LRREKSDARFALVLNVPCTWHARIRSSSITGVFDASDNSKAFSTVSTIFGRLGRGSSSHICDFIAKAWLLSWMIDAPSP
jgi:hypothetical protein